MMIACCDSRSAPDTIFDAAPGELFVVRNVANLVPPCDADGAYHGTSSALEYAVQSLQVRHIVVLGTAGAAVFGPRCTQRQSRCRLVISSAGGCACSGPPSTKSPPADR